MSVTGASTIKMIWPPWHRKEKSIPRRWTVAVIGCGIGRTHIHEGYQRLPQEFELRALCARSPARLTKVADEFGLPRRTTSFAEVLTMPDIDIVDIGTPPALHFKQISLALAAG